MGGDNLQPFYETKRTIHGRKQRPEKIWDSNAPAKAKN